MKALPRAVWAITALWLAILLTWSVVLPQYRSPDEVSHISAAKYLEEYRSWPGYKQQPHLRSVLDQRPPQHRGFQPLAAEDAPPVQDRAEVGEVRGEGGTTGTNTVGQHPPAYYALLAIVSEALPDSIRVDLEVWIFRLVNVLLMAPLPLLVAGIVRRFGADSPAVITAALMPLGIPQLGATGASVNNDNLLTLTGFLVVAGLSQVLTGDRRARTAVLIGTALAVGLLTKAWALLFVPVIVLAYALAAYRTRRVLEQLRGLVTVAAVAALGGWWWLRNLAVYGAVQPAGHYDRLAEPLAPAEAITKFVGEAAEIPKRFWVMLSIRHPAGEPPFPTVLTTVLFVALVVLAIVPILRSRTYGARRLESLVLVSPFFLTAAVLLAQTWRLHLATGVPAGLQGRYLFVGLGGVLAMVAMTITSLVPRRARAAVPLVLGVAALTFSAAAVREVLRYHWAYRGSSLRDGLAAVAAWSPVPDAVLTTVLALGVVSLLGSVLLAASALRRGRERDLLVLAPLSGER